MPDEEYARIDTRQRFDNALESLVTEACRAYDHWNLLLHINESSEEYIREIYQTVFFWNTVQRSLQDGVILRLATMLDPRKDVVRTNGASLMNLDVHFPQLICASVPEVTLRIRNAVIRAPTGESSDDRLAVHLGNRRHPGTGDTGC